MDTPKQKKPGKFNEKEAARQQALVQTLFKEKSTYEQSTQDLRREYVDIFNAFQGDMEKVKNVPYKSKKAIPKLRTESAYIKGNIFSGEPVLEVEPEGKDELDIMVAQYLEKIGNYRFRTIPNFFDKIESWAGQGVDFGTSLIFPIWVFKTKKYKEKVQVPQEDGSVAIEEKEYEKVIKDEPDLLTPNIIDCYFNRLIPQINGEGGQSSLIYGWIKSGEEVRNNQLFDAVGPDGVLNRTKVVGQSSIPVTPYDSSAQLPAQALNSQLDTVIGFVRVTHDKVYEVADGKEKLLLREYDNPYGCINAVKFIFEKNCIPNFFDGVGTGQNTLGIGKIFYQSFAQLGDIVKLIGNPMFMFRKGLGIDKRQLVAKPGGGIEINTKEPLDNVMRVISFPDVKQGTMDYLNKVDDEHKRASGANDLIQGGSSSETLGQDKIAITSTTNRFENVRKRFNNALSDLAKMLIEMELLNLQSPDAPILKIFPEEDRPMIYQLLINVRDNLKFNVKIKANSAIARNRDAESKRLTELFALSKDILIDREKRAFLRKIATRQGEEDVDDMIMERNPELEAQMQQQGMGGMPTDQGQGMSAGQVMQRGINDTGYGVQ